MKACLAITFCLFIYVLLKYIKTKQQLLKTQKYIEVMQDEVSAAKMQNVIIKNCISQDLHKAVKFAMIKSHPDNGGSEDDFYKFRKLYEIYR